MTTQSSTSPMRSRPAVATTTLLVLLSATTLAACDRSQAPAPTATATPAAGSNDAPQTVLGRTVETAMAKARHELETGNLDLSNGPDINVGGHGRHFRIGGSTDGSNAQLTPQGDLLIDGKAVALTPAQRSLLLEYRHELIGVAETGMAIGVRGADLAGKAVLDTFAGLMHGDTDQASKRIEAEGKRIQAQAVQICTQLPALLATQQDLAASLPEFKPYANMTQQDIDDCAKNGASVTDNRGIGDEVRQQIRDNVRQSIRHPTGSTDGTSADDSTPQQAH